MFLDMSRETQHVILITVNMKNTISLFFGRLDRSWAELNTHAIPDKETYKDRLYVIPVTFIRIAYKCNLFLPLCNA